MPVATKQTRKPEYWGTDAQIRDAKNNVQRIQFLLLHASHMNHAALQASLFAAMNELAQLCSTEN